MHMADRLKLGASRLTLDVPGYMSQSRLMHVQCSSKGFCRELPVESSQMAHYWGCDYIIRVI